MHEWGVILHFFNRANKKSVLHLAVRFYITQLLNDVDRSSKGNFSSFHCDFP